MRINPGACSILHELILNVKREILENRAFFCASMFKFFLLLEKSDLFCSWFHSVGFVTNGLP